MYNIIATGSKGNAVIVNSNILIDCGVPFKALREHYKKLRLVLMSHIHSDHFNCSTIKKLASERPTLRFGVPHWLVTDLIDCGVDKRNIDVLIMGGGSVYPNFCTIKPEKTKHNVDNCCYHIWIGDKSVFYATDCNNLDGIEAKDYNLYLVESNYCEDEIAEKIQQKRAIGEYSYELNVISNHMSKQKIDRWLLENIGNDSEVVYLHGHEE